MTAKKEKPTSNDSILWLLLMQYSSNFLTVVPHDTGTSEIKPDGTIYSTINITYPPDKNKATIKSHSYFSDKQIEKILRETHASPDSVLDIKDADKWLIPASNFGDVVRRDDFLKLRLNLAAGFYDLLSQAQAVGRSANKGLSRSKIKLPASTLRLSLWDAREQIRATLKASEAMLKALGIAPLVGGIKKRKESLEAHIVGRELIGSILTNGIVPDFSKQLFPQIQASLWGMMPRNLLGEPFGEDLPEKWQREFPSILPFMMPWFSAHKSTSGASVTSIDAISFYAHVCDSVRLLYVHAKQADERLTGLLEPIKNKNRNDGKIGFRNFFAVLCQTWELVLHVPVSASKDFIGFAQDVCTALNISDVTAESLRGQIKSWKKEGATSYAPLHKAFDEILAYNHKHIQTKLPVDTKWVAESF